VAWRPLAVAITPKTNLFSRLQYFANLARLDRLGVQQMVRRLSGVLCGKTCFSSVI
jgi:hypothetical protein